MPEGKLWFEYENYRRHARYADLSEMEKAIVEQIRSEGYYLYKNALGDDLIERINDALDEWMTANLSGLAANKRADGTYPRLIGLHEEVPVIRELFRERVTLLLRDLLFGHRCARCTSITFLQGSQQPLHRDIPVYRISPGGFYYRIWFALEDTTPENGALTGVRGGHRVAADPYATACRYYERFEAIPEQDPERWRAGQEALKRQYEAAGLAEEPFALARGDVLIWHPLFPHGGRVIDDKKSSRRSVVLHVSVVPPF